MGFKHSTVEYRNSQFADAEQIAKLCQQFGYQVNSQRVGETLERIANDEKQVVFIASHKEFVVGWIHVFIADRLESQTFAEIGGLIIDQAYRNRGIGSMLFSKASEWSEKQNNLKLRVRCADQRKQAHEFYFSMGMNKIKTQYIFDKDLR